MVLGLFHTARKAARHIRQGQRCVFRKHFPSVAAQIGEHGFIFKGLADIPDKILRG